MNDQDPKSAAVVFAEAADQLRLIVELTAGYRRQLVEAGFSAAAAEAMAMMFHGEIVHRLFSVDTPTPNV